MYIMYKECLLISLFLVYGQLNCHDIKKEKYVRDLADKVADLVTETRHECTLTPSDDLDFRPSDCGDLKKAVHKSGVYKIYPDRTSGFHVFCDMKSYEGGWTLNSSRLWKGCAAELSSTPTCSHIRILVTNVLPFDIPQVIQNRTNDYIGFYRDWDAYKDGFGDLKTDFWLGNEHLNKLTEQGYYILRIDMWDFEDNHKYATYDTFVVRNEKSGYTLEVAGYNGNAGNALSNHNGNKFYTRDRDSTSNCAVTSKGGWWYSNCHHANLNGRYLNGTHKTIADGINWLQWKGYYYSLKASRMMIRRT